MFVIFSSTHLRNIRWHHRHQFELVPPHKTLCASEALLGIQPWQPNLYKIRILEVKQFRLNRLVALQFIPNPENKSDVDHINDIKTDNRLENLQWLTTQENLAKRITVTNTGYKYISIEINKGNKYYRICNYIYIGKCIWFWRFDSSKI